MRRLLVAAALIAFASSAMAQDAMKVVKADGLTWREHPVFKGAQTVLLIGDPTKAETIVQRVKFPPNYKVPPHTHPYAEVVTVMSGTFGNSMGEKFDPSKGGMFKAGSIFALPAKHAHYVWTTDEEVVVQIHFTGPGGYRLHQPGRRPTQEIKTPRKGVIADAAHSSRGGRGEAQLVPPPHRDGRSQGLKTSDAHVA